MKVLKFSPSLADKILSRKKTSTWRLFDDKELEEGDVIALFDRATGKQFALATIISVTIKTLGTLTDADWEGHERYVSEEAMYAQYRTYYGDKVNENSELKMITFVLHK